MAILIFAVGSGISIDEGVHHLLHPTPLKNAYVNYIVLSIAMVFEAGALYIAWRGFNAHRGKRGYYEAVRHCKDPTFSLCCSKTVPRCRAWWWHFSACCSWT